MTRWSPRRRIALLVAAPVLALWYFAVSQQPGGAPSPPWWALTLTAAVLGAGIVAGYVPERGSKPDMGCSPCAAMSGLTLLASTFLMASYRSDLVGPALAAAVTAYGLVQRSASAARCAVPPGL